MTIPKGHNLYLSLHPKFLYPLGLSTKFIHKHSFSSSSLPRSRCSYYISHPRFHPSFNDIIMSSKFQSSHSTLHTYKMYFSSNIYGREVENSIF